MSSQANQHEAHALVDKCNSNPAFVPPPNWLTALKSAQQILEMRIDKEKRSALHDVVHTFRTAHGYRSDQPSFLERYGCEYRNSLRQYVNLAAPYPTCYAVEALCGSYAEIRHAGRMRRSMGALSEKQLAFFTREIRAALNWRARIES